MPQLDPISFASQLFWLTLSFVVLYLLMARVLLPRVQSVLSLRASTITGDLDQAVRMKKEAEIARDQYEAALATARARSHDLLADAQAQIVATAAKKQAELDTATERKLAEATTSIAKAKGDVMDKLAPVSSELASLIVEALVNHKPQASDVSAAIAKEKRAA